MARSSIELQASPPAPGGVGIAAFVVYLLHYQLLPEDSLAEPMADLFGVKLAAATIARMSRTCAERLRGSSKLGQTRSRRSVATVCAKPSAGSIPINWPISTAHCLLFWVSRGNQYVLQRSGASRLSQAVANVL
jgi:hypothetical protein